MKVLLTLGLMLFAMIPGGLWFMLFKLLGPVGFWQNLILFGIGAWMFGTMQIVFLIWSIFLIVAVWSA